MSLCDPVDPLYGPRPTWRDGDDPTYRSVVADLGPPGLDEPAGPGPVIVGDTT